MNYTGIHSEISSQKEIEALGFKYMPNTEASPIRYLNNNIVVSVDMREHREVELKEIENKVDTSFIKDLVSRLRLDAGVKKLSKVEWDRYFQIGELWDTRDFKVRYSVRIY